MWEPMDVAVPHRIYLRVGPEKRVTLQQLNLKVNVKF